MYSHDYEHGTYVPGSEEKRKHSHKWLVVRMWFVLLWFSAAFSFCLYCMIHGTFLLKQTTIHERKKSKSAEKADIDLEKTSDS